MRSSLLLFIMLFFCANLFSQTAKNKYFIDNYKQASTFYAAGNYPEALMYYLAAFKYAEAKDKDKTSELISKCIKKIQLEEQSLKEQAELNERHMLELIKKKSIIDSLKLWNSLNRMYNMTDQKTIDKIPEIDLNYSDVEVLPDDVYKFRALRRLRLIGNPNLDLEKLFQNLNRLPELREIHMDIHDTTVIPMAFWDKITGVRYVRDQRETDSLWKVIHLLETKLNLNSVKYLDISKCGITYMDGELSELRNLEDLDLSGNKIGLIPGDIKNLRKLKRLNISGNEIRELPPEFYELRQIEYLNISNNSISALSKNIFQLENLKSLNLSYNRFDMIPSQISRIPSVREIGLDTAQILNNAGDILRLSSLLKRNFSSYGREMYKKRHYATAIRYFNAAVGQEPSYDGILALYSAGKAYDDLKEDEFARTCYKSALEKFRRYATMLTEDYGAYRNTRSDLLLAKMYFGLRYFDSSYKMLEKIVTDDSENPEFWYELSWCSLFAGNYKRAVFAAKKTLELDSTLTSVHKNEALGYLLDGDEENARMVYTKWKHQYFSDLEYFNLGRDVFLKDLEDMAEYGISSGKFRYVQDLLKE